MDTNNHKGHRKRMREDFEKGGFKTWQKHKVLEYLLYNVIPVADTNDIAHNLIKECGGFVNVFHTSKKRLMSIDGVGEKTADYICSLGEFIQYYNTEKYNTDVFVLNSETSENYLCNLFDGKSRECCYMICLDPKYSRIGGIGYLVLNALTVFGQIVILVIFQTALTGHHQ